MECLEGLDESFYVPACAKQAEGTRKSMPSWSQCKASRDGDKKVFISNKHQQDLKGKDSPGFAYSPQRQRKLPSWGFGTAPQRPAISKPRYPEPVNDLIGTIPDSQKFKYKNKGVSMGICSRDVITNAPDLEGYPLGAISPGPQRYNVSNAPFAHRLSHAPKADENPPKYTMRLKTKLIESESQTPAKVGPGTYPAHEACGTQYSSVKPSKPQWGLHRHDRFPGTRNRDPGRLWDGRGGQKSMHSRTCSLAPSFSFGTSTREGVKRVARTDTDLDKGPAGAMGKPWQSHPQLPQRREVMKYSEVPAA